MIKDVMKKLSCNPLACIATYLVILGMLLTPIYSGLSQVNNRVEKVYEYIMAAYKSHDIALASLPTRSLALSRNSARPTQ